MVFLDYIHRGTKYQDEQNFFSSAHKVCESYVKDFFIKMNFSPKGKRMLDIGCGVGQITRYFSKLFAEAHGVDFSEKMIEKAIDLNRDRPNLFFKTNNGVDLSIYQSNFFDFCFSVATFQYIPSVKIIGNYFKEISRILKEGGLFKIQLDGRKWVRPGLPTRPGKKLFSPIPFYRPLYNFLRNNYFVGLVAQLMGDPITVKSYLRGMTVSWKTVQKILQPLPLEAEIIGKDTALMWVQGRKICK